MVPRTSGTMSNVPRFACVWVLTETFPAIAFHHHAEATAMMDMVPLRRGNGSADADCLDFLIMKSVL